MNYIKLFENFNSLSDDIKDILSELSDKESAEVKVRQIERGPNKIIVTIGNELTDLDMISINPLKYQDEFLRLKDFMELNGYKFSSISYDDRGDIKFPKTELGLKGEELFDHLFSIYQTNYIRFYFK